MPGYVQDGTEPGHGNENTVVSADGYLSSRRGTVKLTYAVPGGIVSCISYSKDEPGLITMTKAGGDERGTLFMVFEQGVRHVCANRVDGDSFEITTYASLIRNTLGTDGHISMDYVVEIHGVRVERTSMKLSVSV